MVCLKFIEIKTSTAAVHSINTCKLHMWFFLFSVIVVTFVTGGRIATFGFPEGHFSHIFMDEAGHATEPESIIPIAGQAMINNERLCTNITLTFHTRHCRNLWTSRRSSCSSRRSPTARSCSSFPPLRQTWAKSFHA